MIATRIEEFAAATTIQRNLLMFTDSEIKKRKRFITALLTLTARAGAIQFTDDIDVTITSESFEAHTSVWRFDFNTVYREYCDVPWWKRRIMLRSIAKQLIELQFCHPLPLDFSTAKSKILPRVRSKAFWDRAARQTRKHFGFHPVKAVKVPTQLLNESLEVELAFDGNSAIMPLSNQALDEWGQRFDDVWQIAIENLKQISFTKFVKSKTGLYISAWKDGHDASRLLLIDLLRTLEISGHRLAMIPSHDMLLIADSNNLDAVHEMAALASIAIEQPRFITATVFRLAGDTWIPHRFDSSHPAKSDFDVLETLDLAKCQQLQQADLQLEVGADLFVASAIIAQGAEPTQTIISYCSWTKGVATLLPECHVLAFVEPATATTIEVKWADAQAIVGDMMSPIGVIPERYRVDEFPDANKLAKLAQLQVPIVNRSPYR